LLGDRITTHENCDSALRNSPTKLLGRIVDRLLQRGHGKGKGSGNHQVQVVRTKKKKVIVMVRMMMRRTMMMAVVMKTHNVHIAKSIFQKTRKERNGCNAQSVSAGITKSV
jgi:hypothetical protein